MAKHRQTKATDINPAVKKIVWERDCECCIICGSIYAAPEAHYIPRSAGGLGIEQNIVTLCRGCHDRFDAMVDRSWMRDAIRNYLVSKYPEWDEKKLYYKKFNF
ncbi:MAG: HNH endonuclease [Christensenella sp.]|nr:HNH endonuclease [Christensenella sp.]